MEKQEPGTDAVGAPVPLTLAPRQLLQMFTGSYRIFN